MSGIDWDYWASLAVWPLDDGCKVICRVNRRDWATRRDVIENPDPSSRPAWVNLWYQARASEKDGKLRFITQTRPSLEWPHIELRRDAFLAWVRENAWARLNGYSIPEELEEALNRARPMVQAEARPSTTIAPDNEPVAKRKAPDIFVAALFCLIAEIGKRSAGKGMPFDVTAMPGTKADFRALAIKFDGKLIKAPSTFNDYLGGLLRFNEGARETNFYRDLFPELFT
jgi:hypothetical protein